MTTKLTFSTQYLRLITLMLAAFLSIYTSAVYANSQWQPVASDTLIKLPAKIIQQRIQDDFSSSPLAQKLHQVEQTLTEQAAQIKSLQTLKMEASGDDLSNVAFDIVDKKSAYLALLKESHELRQQALDKRQNLYENILSKINQKLTKNATANNYQIKAAQQAAQARMAKNQLAVEQALHQYQQTNNLSVNDGDYQSHYQRNIAKISQLKATLARHSFNEKPQIEGVEVSDQEYIRALLMKLATERSLLAQENTMLAYMTKLVALDAESLTAQLSQNINSTTSMKQQTYTPADQVTELFVEGDYYE